MVKHPKDYKWSSYRYYAYGEEDPLITPAKSYLELGETPEERQRAYREMVGGIMVEDSGIDYEHKYCIGDPDWVKARYEELKEKQRKRRQAYLRRRWRWLKKCGSIHVHVPP